MSEHGYLNFILGKALRVSPKTNWSKSPKPVRNLRHSAPLA
jgi:hypothetical protein